MRPRALCVLAVSVRASVRVRVEVCRRLLVLRLVLSRATVTTKYFKTLAFLQRSNRIQTPAIEYLSATAAVSGRTVSPDTTHGQSLNR